MTVGSAALATAPCFHELRSTCFSSLLCSWH